VFVVHFWPKMETQHIPNSIKIDETELQFLSILEKHSGKALGIHRLLMTLYYNADKTSGNAGKSRECNELEKKLLELQMLYELSTTNDTLLLELKQMDAEYEELERRFHEPDLELQRRSPALHE